MAPLWNRVYADVLVPHLTQTKQVRKTLPIKHFSRNPKKCFVEVKANSDIGVQSTACNRILEKTRRYYDADKKYPVYGFGAKLPPSHVVLALPKGRPLPQNLGLGFCIETESTW